MFESYEWGRPEGLWLLALPILLLLLMRLSSSPEVLATGTLDIWKQVAAGARTAGRRVRHRVPLSVWILVVGLCAGALAVGDPRPAALPNVKRFVCVVDPSASMFLPTNEGTRLELAATLAREWLAGNTSASDEIVWVREVNGAREEVLGSELPAAWLTAPRVPQEEPRWSDFDQPGTLWLTDRAGEKRGAVAVLIASGGPAVPGPVATRGALRFDWNGEEVVPVEGGAELGSLSLKAEDEALLAPEVAAFARLWAEQRGLSVNAADAEERLVLRAGSGTATPVILERDGWRFDGFATALNAEAGTSDVWLRRGDEDYVRVRPGLIECGLTRTEKLGGDRAAFAVSWAALFDSAALPASGVIDLEERVAAGEEEIRMPHRTSPLAQETPLGGGVPLTAWLALLAFLCAAISSALGLRQRSAA